MKKLISITLVFVMLLSLFSGTVLAADTDTLVVTAQNVRTIKNSWVTVTLHVEQNPGFQGMSFYPVITDANGNKVSWDWEVDTTFSDLSFDVNEDKMVVLTADGDQNNTGVLLQMRFFVDPDAALGEYSISFLLYNGECFDASGNSVSTELPVVSVGVTEILYGDANGDGIVNLLDVLQLRKYLVNLDVFTGESTAEIAPGADANGDGVVNLIDVLLLRRYMASRDPETGESSVVLGPSVIEPSEPGGDDTTEGFPAGDYIWKTSSYDLSTNWNPHTYQTNDQSVPLDYTTSGLYTFIFNDELHPVEGKNPYEGYVIVPEMAAEMPIDVTESFKAANPQWNIPADATSGYAYVIKLNPDACFDDGTPINAETYVQSMERLLRPELLNYRAADWYGSNDLSIAGAENYNNQGGARYIDDASCVVADLVKGEDGNYYTADGYAVYVAVAYPTAWCGGNSLYDYVNAYAEAYFGMERWEELVALMDDNGLVPANDETLAMLSATTTTNPAWGESDLDLPNYLVYNKAYPENWDFSQVGVIATGEYELTIVLEKALSGFYLLYNLSGLSNNLVKIDLYDACLKQEGDVWTSTYNTSVDTTVSFGPYKMSEYQMDQYMHFVRNENWWGYSDGKHIYVDPTDGKTYPMYQTTEVDIQVISTNKLMFMKGELMEYGLQADDYATLRQSQYCFATPGTTTFFLILNGHMQAIENREAAADFDQATQDLEMLTNTAFHMALGLSYDKDDFAATVSPARSGALGIIGTGYIYDPETGAKYRDTEQAKQVLCDFYGVDVSQFATLDDAVDSITGYDPEQAKVLFTQAFQEGIAAGYITDTNNDGICDQTIRIEYAMSSAVSDFMTRTINYLNEKAAEVATGTPFEGKIEFFMSDPYGNDWSQKIREGMSDTVLGGWSGSTMNPFSLTDLYTNPDRQYDAAWYDATKVALTLNVPVNGVNQDVTMSLKQWSDALNGIAVEAHGVTYNFGPDWADVEVRLDILAAIEGKVLESYNYLPMLEDGSMSLLSKQVYYVIEDYNYIMGRGGLAYTKYNMNEAEWFAYIASQGGDLTEEYQKPKPSPNFDPAAKSEGVMTYAEYAAAAMDSKVVIEAYVQATQSWWDNKITVYAQDPDGAYFIYNLACSEADAAKLTKGTKIRVTGYKGAWAGEIEIMDGTFEIVTDGTWVAEAKDVTALLGTDELIKHQNEFVAFKGMTIEAINYKHGEPGDDIYVDVSYNGATYSFCVERYLTGPETDVYKAFADLQVGDKVDIEGFLYWYEGVYTQITSVKVVESYDPYAAGYDGSNVTITFYHTMGSNLSAVLNSYIEEFNQLYPNIHIQHQQVGTYDDVCDQIKTELTVGNQPNIAYCYPDHVALYNIARAVVTLDDLIASEVEIPRADGSVEVMGLTDAQIADFIEGFYNDGKQFGDGLMYTMPMTKSTEVLYYNKTFFEEHNLTVPTTWDEMEELCARILEIDPSCIPLGYDSESNWFINMCAQYGSDYTSATGEHFLFDNAVNRDFVARFRQWYQKGYVTTQQIYGAYTSSLFVAQTGTNSYMSIASSAGASHQRPTKTADGYPFEVGIAPIPQVDAENPKVISQGPSLCIFKDANPQEVIASWLFVKFLTTNVNFQAEFSMASGYMPVLKSVTQNRTYAQYLAKADGGDYISALSAKICLQQEKAYYTSPAFNGSTTAREQVGMLMVNAFTANDNGNVDVLLNELFTEAVEECRNTIGQTTAPSNPSATLEDAKAYLAAFYQGVDGTVVHNDFSLITTVMIDGVSFPITWTTDTPDFVTICAPAYNMVKIDIIEHPADQVIFQLTGTVTDAQGNTASVTITRVIEAKIGGVTFVDAPVADTAYKYVVEQNNLGQLLYFTGEMSGHYLATSITSAEGVDVFVEDVAGGQRLYFYNAEGVKTYIDIVPRGVDYPGKVNVILTETPSCIYQWDAERGTFITEVEGITWYLGCYNTYNTISASNTSYIENVEVIGDTQFPAGLCTVTYIEDPALAWSVIGEIGDSNWAVDFPMTKVNDNTWESAPLQLRAGANFKIRQGAAWDVNYGINGEKDGPNLVVEADGNYKIQLILEGDVATINLIPV